jgi:BMFP domain-containing protein YqiC
MFLEIEDYYTKIRAEIEAKAKADLDALTGDVQKLSADVQTAINQAKAEVLKEAAQYAPDVQAAVQKAIADIEQAVLAAIVARLG